MNYSTVQISEWTDIAECQGSHTVGRDIQVWKREKQERTQGDRLELEVLV